LSFGISLLLWCQALYQPFTTGFRRVLYSIMKTVIAQSQKLIRFRAYEVPSPMTWARDILVRCSYG
jgi:hypothetical protein